MFSVKKQFLHNVNQVMGINPIFPEGEQALVRLRLVREIPQRINRKVLIYHQRFIRKYGNKQFVIPRFRWQKSYHDHIIRNEKDFNYHINYIATNPVKHGLVKDERDYRWSSLNPEFKDLVDYFGV